MKTSQILLCLCIILSITSFIFAEDLNNVEQFLKGLKFGGHGRRGRGRGHFVEEIKLENVTPFGLNQLIGPEGLAFDSQGFGYTGCADGVIRKIDFETGDITEYARSVTDLTDEQKANCGQPQFEPICGRPLGLEFDSQDNLYVADAYKGLLFFGRQDPSNTQVLASAGPDGEEFKLVNDVAISPDEKIVYFTDTSKVYTRARFVRITLDSNPDGRLLSYNIATGEVKTLIDDLEFANGIAFSENEHYMAIVETSARRIRRYFPYFDYQDVLADNLIGYPDNIHQENGLFYLGMFTETSDVVEGLQDLDSFRPLVYEYIPDMVVLSAVPRAGLVAAYDGFGRLRKTFIDEDASDIAFVSEGYPRNGKLYLGSVINPFLGVFDLPEDDDNYHH